MNPITAVRPPVPMPANLRQKNTRMSRTRSIGQRFGYRRVADFRKPRGSARLQAAAWGSDSVTA